MTSKTNDSDGGSGARFSDLVGDDVTPIQTEKRVRLSHGERDERVLEARREAAQSLPASEQDQLSSRPMEMVEPYALLSFKRPGIQHGVFRSLRLGKYQIEARLDLHQLTVERARREVARFVTECLQHDLRTVLIAHGTGAKRDKQALLKSCVAHWLQEIPDVLAYHTALKQHGGYGATYLLIRKSDRKKDETREQHSRR